MRKRKTLAKRRKRLLLLEDHITIFGFHFGVDSISEEVAGFSPFMVSPRKKQYVHCLLCLIAVLVILLVKDPNIMLA